MGHHEKNCFCGGLGCALRVIIAIPEGSTATLRSISYYGPPGVFPALKDALTTYATRPLGTKLSKRWGGTILSATFPIPAAVLRTLFIWAT